MVDVFGMEIDSLGCSGGSVFVSGRASFFGPYYKTWRVSPTGGVILFASGTQGDLSLPTFAFGPGHAMYVPAYLPNTGQAVTNRIMGPFAPRVPVSGTSLLVCISAACVVRFRRSSW